MTPPSSDAPANASATIKIHGNSRIVDISLDGIPIGEFITKFKDAFAIPDNATPIVNGREADEVKPGDVVTFQTRAAAKA